MHSRYLRAPAAEWWLSKWTWRTRQRYLVPGELDPRLATLVWVCPGARQSPIRSVSTNMTPWHHTPMLVWDFRWLLSLLKFAVFDLERCSIWKGKGWCVHCVPIWFEFSDKAPTASHSWYSCTTSDRLWVPKGLFQTPSYVCTYVPTSRHVLLEMQWPPLAQLHCFISWDDDISTACSLDGASIENTKKMKEKKPLVAHSFQCFPLCSTASVVFCLQFFL